MYECSLLTSHAKALVCIAQDPNVRLRVIASTLGITERSAYTLVDDLAESGYVVKERVGRRSRYAIVVDAPLSDAIGREVTVGELLKLLVGSPTSERKQRSRRR